MEINPYPCRLERLGSFGATLENEEGCYDRSSHMEAGMMDKNIRSSHPSKRDLTVACSPYYRCRADTQRALKGSRPKTEQQANSGSKGKDDRMATLATWRALEGLSIEELAARAKLPVSQIRSIEAGNLDVPLSAYLKLAKALKLSVENIIGHAK